MARFKEIEKSNQELESIIFEDKIKTGGYRNDLAVEIVMQLNNIQVDDGFNGRIGNYKATFTATNNQIYGVTIDQVQFWSRNTGWDIVDDTYNFGEVEHYVDLTG